MEKNTIFTFKAPNGVEVTAIVVDILMQRKGWEWYLCYAQNRLFHYQLVPKLEPIISTSVEYLIIPEYDELLKESL